MTTAVAIRAAEARWARRRRRAIAAGTWQPWADATPVRQHVTTIRDTGMSLTTLAERTGVTLATLDYLIYGKDGQPPAAKVRSESAAALLAYRPVLDDYPDGAIVDATGTRRRLRALAVLGWPMSEITRRLPGYNAVTAEHISQGQRTRTTAATARAVRAVYRTAAIGRAEDHGVLPWVAARARRRARRNGWHSPVAWDGPAIDDPAALPDTGGTLRRAALAARRGDHIPAEIRHLADLGESEHQIARAVRRSPQYVHDVITAHRSAQQKEAA
jgi:hypothetical protein